MKPSQNIKISIFEIKRKNTKHDRSPLPRKPQQELEQAFLHYPKKIKIKKFINPLVLKQLETLPLPKT